MCVCVCVCVCVCIFYKFEQEHPFCVHIMNLFHVVWNLFRWCLIH